MGIGHGACPEGLSLGVGKQMEEQISYDPAHQHYHIITQGLKEPTPNSLKPGN